MDQRVKDDAIEKSMEGLDERLRPEYKASHPPRRRHIDVAEAFLYKRWGREPAPTRPLRRRWATRDVAMTERWRRLMRRIGDVKGSTLSSYSSIVRGYVECCATWTPPMSPFPPSAEAVGMWLGARWAKGRKSNKNNTKPLISAVTHHTVNVLGLLADVAPYPGMEPRQRKKLARMCTGLAELEDMAVRRSIPLTILMLRLFLEERIVEPCVYYEGITAVQLRAVRDLARYGLNRVCMLRKDDCSAEKQLHSMYKKLPDGFQGSLMVDPGKSHSTHPRAQVPGLAELSGTWEDWLSPGYAMSEWRRCYEAGMPGGVAADAPMFPSIRDDGTITGAADPPKRLQASLRVWAREVGFPEEFAALITLHGFRSGGCTDAINDGMDPLDIKRQGRWSGPAFEMYAHLCHAAVRAAFERVVRRQAMTAVEARAAEQQREGARMQQWFDAYGTAARL